MAGYPACLVLGFHPVHAALAAAAVAARSSFIPNAYVGVCTATCLLRVPRTRPCRFAIQCASDQPIPSPLHGGALANDQLTENIALRKAIVEWETKFCKLISSSNVTIVELIGRGSFKVVHRAELRVPGSPQDHPMVRGRTAVPACVCAARHPIHHRHPHPPRLRVRG